MGFRRSMQLLPCIRLNLSKSGVSTSIGVRGAHVTLGHDQLRETVGIPGTDVSYTSAQTHHDAPGQAQPQPVPKHRHVVGVPVLAGLVCFFVHLLLTHGGR